MNDRKDSTAWVDAFVGRLAAVGGELIFNPYSERCPWFDEHDAAAIRSENLRCLLVAAADLGVDAIWFGQELGHKGGRRTGIPLSDDTRLAVWGDLFGVRLRRATHGRAFREHTAGYVAQALQGLGGHRVLGWNAFPLHTHKPGRPFSNRAHNRHEAEVGAPFARELVVRMQPKRLVAIGQSAASLLQALDLGVPVTVVRHPSNGGARSFLEQIPVASRPSGER